ncbi:hypothetical protein GF336_02425 [Candidatus Woesearchaeota archaeon]|nr:hypothetical protein [Candidatus Woesearchaeota archaeon]
MLKDPNETGYTAIETFMPDACRVFGVDDSKEMKQLNNIKKEVLETALKYIPKKEDLLDTVKVRDHDKAVEMIYEKRRKLNDDRSRIYLKKGIEKADSLDEKNLAIVIGAAHLKLMAEEYKGKRRLYVINTCSYKKRR